MHQGFHLCNICGAWLKSHDGAKNLTPKEIPDFFCSPVTGVGIYHENAGALNMRDGFPH